MTREQLRALVVGDRVELRLLGGNVLGQVVRKFRGVAWVEWARGGGTWTLDPRSGFDRERARYVVLISPADDRAPG